MTETKPKSKPSMPKDFELTIDKVVPNSGLTYNTFNPLSDWYFTKGSAGPYTTTMGNVSVNTLSSSAKYVDASTIKS